DGRGRRQREMMQQRRVAGRLPGVACEFTDGGVVHLHTAKEQCSVLAEAFADLANLGTGALPVLALGRSFVAEGALALLGNAVLRDADQLLRERTRALLVSHAVGAEIGEQPAFIMPQRVPGIAVARLHTAGLGLQVERHLLNRLAVLGRRQPEHDIGTSPPSQGTSGSIKTWPRPSSSSTSMQRRMTLHQRRQR